MYWVRLGFLLFFSGVISACFLRELDEFVKKGLFLSLASTGCVLGGRYWVCFKGNLVFVFVCVFLFFFCFEEGLLGTLGVVWKPLICFKVYFRCVWEMQSVCN